MFFFLHPFYTPPVFVFGLCPVIISMILLPVGLLLSIIFFHSNFFHSTFCCSFHLLLMRQFHAFLYPQVVCRQIPSESSYGTNWVVMASIEP